MVIKVTWIYLMFWNTIFQILIQEETLVLFSSKPIKIFLHKKRQSMQETACEYPQWESLIRQKIKFTRTRVRGGTIWNLPRVELAKQVGFIIVSS